MPRHLPLSGLRVFEAVTRSGSFRSAADDLGLTASAVSHAIRTLERDLEAEESAAEEVAAAEAEVLTAEFLQQTLAEAEADRQAFAPFAGLSERDFEDAIRHGMKARNLNKILPKPPDKPKGKDPAAQVEYQKQLEEYHRREVELEEKLRQANAAMERMIQRDRILEGLVDKEMSVREVADSTGEDIALVANIESMLLKAEYKRRQAPPGVKIGSRNFGRDRRYPISNFFHTGPKVKLPR